MYVKKPESNMGQISTFIKKFVALNNKYVYLHRFLRF